MQAALPEIEASRPHPAKNVATMKQATAGPLRESFEIRVPGSIANLGPGFETLAVAVQLYVTLRATRRQGFGELQFHRASPRAGEKRIARAFHHLAGSNSARLPSLSIEIASEIPPDSGLGSSAAETVAGLRLYEAVAGPQPVEKLLNAACELESRPENAAASLLGGLTVSCAMPDNSVYATKYPWPESLAFVVATPATGVAPKSPASLPASVSRADLVFNLQRMALLLQLLRNGDFSLLRQALTDRVHQPFREDMVPGLAEALDLDHPDLLGICLSGSGPSIVALAERNLWDIGKLMGAIYQRSGIEYQLRVLEAHQENSSRPEVFRSGLLCCS